MGLKNPNELNTTQFALVTWSLITDAVLYAYPGSSFAHLSASLYSDSFDCPLTQNGSWIASPMLELAAFRLRSSSLSCAWRTSSENPLQAVWLGLSVNDPWVLTRWPSKSNGMSGKNLFHQDGNIKLHQELQGCGLASIFVHMVGSGGHWVTSKEFSKSQFFKEAACEKCEIRYA